MRYEKKDDGTHVYVEGSETEFEVLRALVQASFDTAIAVGMGLLHYNRATKLGRNDAEKFIDKSRWDTPNAEVVNMDYVQGRQCKTTIWRVEKNHFKISTRLFERDRGNIENMLNVANELIEKERGSGEKTDSSLMFVGENLDKRLTEYGCTRKVNESDWDFRKRIFPDLHMKIVGDVRALEFLYGKSHNQWSDVEGLLALNVITESNPHKLKQFADGFAADPLKMWPLVEA